MRHSRRLKYFVGGLALCCLASSAPLRAQSDIQQTVRAFLQAWYVDGKGADELKAYIANDNGFNLAPPPARVSATTSKPSTERALKPMEKAAPADPVTQLFTGAFKSTPPSGTSTAPSENRMLREEHAVQRPLGDFIEYVPVKSMAKCSSSPEFAVCRPADLPKGSLLPSSKPSGNDPVANFLWHLSQAYKNKLYIVMYSTKAEGLVREGVIQYWIQEGNSWKLAAFVGLD
jgi:hypothetical protein